MVSKALKILQSLKESQLHQDPNNYLFAMVSKTPD